MKTLLFVTMLAACGSKPPPPSNASPPTSTPVAKVEPTEKQTFCKTPISKSDCTTDADCKDGKVCDPCPICTSKDEELSAGLCVAHCIAPDDPARSKGR